MARFNTRSVPKPEDDALDPEWGTGVTFIGVPDADREEVKAWLNEHGNKRTDYEVYSEKARNDLWENQLVSEYSDYMGEKEVEQIWGIDWDYAYLIAEQMVEHDEFFLSMCEAMGWDEFLAKAKKVVPAANIVQGYTRRSVGEEEFSVGGHTYYAYEA